MNSRSGHCCWIVLPLALLGLLAGGCSGTSELTLSPAATRQSLSHTFEQAYLSRTEQGDYQVVLIDDGGAPAAHHDIDQPIQPAATPPLRQIVFIRVFWRPMKGSKSDFPSASNAALDWYVFGTGGRGETDMVHYQGVGFVAINRSGDSANLRIDNAVVKPATVRGEIHDPIGRAALTGTVHARISREKVQTILAELKVARQGVEARAAAETSPSMPPE